MSRHKGRAWVFPGDVTTDDILPGRYLDHASDEVGQFAMAGIDPTFASRVEHGDIVVGGAGFGSGSGRESAPYALLHAGVGAVVARSYGRVFFRNCVNLGLPAVIVDNTDDLVTGDELAIDLEVRAVANVRSGVVHPIRNLTGISRDILRAGGIVAYTRARLQRASREERS